MSSTYSELKFELMGTGEQAGVWGAKTNTNLGTAINEAIANLAPVDTGSGNYTFTWTNTNTTQAARHFGLNLYTTGSHASPYDVTVPAIQKPYMVNNSSGATATVKISGGSGIAVPNNKTTMVYANGSNVVQMFDYMPSLTIGTLTVNTPLALTSGGTGATAIAAGIVTSDGSSLSSVPTPSGALVGTTEPQTLTNKNIQSRVYSTNTTSTLIPDPTQYDMAVVTSQAGSLAFTAAGSASQNGAKYIFRVTAATTSTLTWDTSSTYGYRAVGVALPSTISSGKTTYFGCMYNTTASKWDVIAISEE